VLFLCDVRAGGRLVEIDLRNVDARNDVREHSFGGPSGEVGFGVEYEAVSTSSGMT
jgi:3-dehydroquinate dehydratase